MKTIWRLRSRRPGFRTVDPQRAWLALRVLAAVAAGALCSACSTPLETIQANLAEIGHLNTGKQADAEPFQIDTDEDVIQEAGGETFVCTVKTYSLTKVPEKFVALNPNADVLWPGSLVQGRSISGGVLDPIPVKRAPGSITLTLASGSKRAFSERMEAPSLSAATAAVNRILSDFEGATPAQFSYSFSSVYNMEQLAVAIDANVQGMSWSGSAAMSFDKSDIKNRVLIQFTQQYYTMAFDPPQGLSGVLDPAVKPADLTPYVGEGNPSVYVASVTYGRIFYLLLESTSSAQDLRAAVSGAYNAAIVSGDVQAEAKHKKIVNDSSIKSYGVGGNAADAIAAAVGGDPGQAGLSQFDLIRKFLITGANFSADSPGVPISYTIRHLYDASQVKVALETTYEARDCKPQIKGCDGKPGSGLVEDQCGVCGGKGDTCDRCSENDDFVFRAGNGAYVRFHLPESDHGSRKRFVDGKYHRYVFPNCRRIGWRDMAFQCNNGQWTQGPDASTWEDIWCESENYRQESMEVGVN